MYFKIHDALIYQKLQKNLIILHIFPLDLSLVCNSDSLWTTEKI